jgi:hypothetical protein
MAGLTLIKKAGFDTWATDRFLFGSLSHMMRDLDEEAGSDIEGVTSAHDLRLPLYQSER